RRDAEVLARVRSFRRAAIPDEVTLRQDDLDVRANVREPTANDAEDLLERLAIPAGIRRSVVCYPVGRVVAIDRGEVPSAVDLIVDPPDERLVLFCRHWPPLSRPLTRTSAE